MPSSISTLGLALLSTWIAPPTRLAPVDLALVAAYLVAITVFGLRFSKKAGKQDRSLKTYFLAGNTIPWWAIALSIVSAETSTLTIVSIPGVAFGGDFGFLQVVLGYMVGRVLVALLFLPRYFRGEMLTAYQLIDQRFGHTLHKVTAGLFLITRAAAEGVRVFAISIVVGIAIGTGDTLSIAIISALTLLYTFEGGMAAVIWTDVVQMGLYVAGTVVALFTLGAHIPGGWTQIHAVAAPLHKFHMLDFSLNLTQNYTFWAGLLGGSFLTMASHGTDQLMVQRMLAARNLRESRIALLSSGVVIFFQFTLFLLIGAGLFVFYGLHPQVFASSDRIFPSFIVQQMPHGVAGLLVAAILAAAMSNLSAALNSLASTTVVDFYMHLRPQADGAERTLISRTATVFWAVVLFAIAVYSIQHGGKGHVVETGLSIASVAYGALLGVFLLGTLTRYATQTGAIAGMVFGFTTNFILWLPSITPIRQIGGIAIPHIAFTWFVLIGSSVTFALGSLASLIFRKQSLNKATAAALILLLATPFGRAEKPVILSEAEGPASGIAPDFTPVSALIQRAIAEKKLPGAVVVIGHGGSIVFERAYGNRALEPSIEPMTEDTIFDMASLSKVLSTTVAVLQLYEQGKIDLDAPVAKYLPAFAQNGKDRITVRELMTHYSGLPEDVDLKDDWGLTTPDKAEGIRRAMASVPYGPAGVTFKYSDINFITLGALVESISGETLNSYAKEHVFKPLEMAETMYHPIFGYCSPSYSWEPPPYGHSDPRLGPPQRCSSSANSALIRLALEKNPRTSPTAHDNEGSSATNPLFDHLLRGTVHDPTTRRMGGVAGHAGVFSTAADTAKFAQALLDKLLFDKGPFPLKQSTLKLATSPNEPSTAVKTATIFTADGKPTTGPASRGLGWDLNSAFSRPRGEVFPITTKGHPGSFGHTGFTGTSLWIDPTTDTYVILLANAIHPRGGAPISVLRGQVATAAAKAIHACPVSTICDDVIVTADSGEIQPDAPRLASETWVSGAATLTGIDVLEQTNFVELKEAAKRHDGHLRIGLLTNQTGLDSHGRRTVDILAHAPAPIQLKALFTPEHGLFGKQDTEHLKAEEDAVTRLPVLNLYGPKPSDKRPKQTDLANLDAIVIDLQDAGVRFYTYESIVGYFVEASAAAKKNGHDLEIIVLDRPTLTASLAADGPISDPGLEAYVNYMVEPSTPAMTLGELAKFVQGEIASQATVTVVPMRDWSHAEFFGDTHLAWVNPSPNLKSARAAVLYPGIGLAETTNISIGRGTDTPFEHIGAPWIQSKELADYLNGRNIPGVRVTPTTLTVAEDANKYPSHGQTIPGVHFEVADRKAFEAPEFGIELLSALHRLYPAEFQLAKAQTILCSASTLAAIERGDDPRAIAASWSPALKEFDARRRKYLLYQ
ncbi:transporter, SSS family [Granulicella rosea]|uniref:Transporter, SSS family n=1 Tax=Granulicella rosea TaxID=474952 RepID=A0A239HNX7_9BACT|nr:sodium/solute symporter [Granulicella rosea]SNS83047.1 transporter, SSS family [Granulicella rosea]